MESWQALIPTIKGIAMTLNRNRGAREEAERFKTFSGQSLRDGGSALCFE